MRILLKTCFLPLLLLVLAATSVQAFYDPSLQRWINRDPLGDAAFLSRLSQKAGPYALEGLTSPYEFIRSDPVGRFDPLGLKANACGNDPDKCMKCMAWAEGRGAGNACMKAIAQVIWNRSQAGNQSMCDVVAASGQFDAYDPKPNKSGNINNGYTECCGDCPPPGQKKKFQEFSDAAANWPEEFGGGDSQLSGATYFHDGAAFPPSWGDRSNYQEVPVPGCSRMHFYRKVR